MFAERKETQPRAQCQTRITSTKTAMPPAPSFRGAPSQNRRPFAHPVPKNAAGGRPLLVGLPPSARFTAPIGTKQSAQAPYSWGLGASTSSRRRWPAALPPPLLVGQACCSPCVIPVQGERKGRFLATLPCPVGARGAAGVRGRRCLPLRGKSASEWRAGFWVVRGGKVDEETVCPSRTVWRARQKDEAYRPALHKAAASTQPSRRENGGLCPHPLKGPDP